MYRVIPGKVVVLYTVGIKTHKELFKYNDKLKTAETKTTIHTLANRDVLLFHKM